LWKNKESPSYDAISSFTYVFNLTCRVPLRSIVHNYCSEQQSGSSEYTIGSVPLPKVYGLLSDAKTCSSGLEFNRAGAACPGLELRDLR
jgi:hypothetical protein